MKFLLDAQLPPSLKQLFLQKGHDCIHTLDLDLGNETPDKMINQISVSEQRIVITKDSDFFDSFIIQKQPYKLILLKLGNTSKNELLQIFRDQREEILKQIAVEDIILLHKKE